MISRQGNKKGKIDERNDGKNHHRPSTSEAIFAPITEEVRELEKEFKRNDSIPDPETVTELIELVREVNLLQKNYKDAVKGILAQHYFSKGKTVNLSREIKMIRSRIKMFLDSELELFNVPVYTTENKAVEELYVATKHLLLQAFKLSGAFENGGGEHLLLLASKAMDLIDDDEDCV